MMAASSAAAPVRISSQSDKVNLSQKLTLFKRYWDPKIVGELNGQQLKLVKFKGEFVWHKHENADELFLVINGSFDMQFRDGTVTLNEGEFIIVPRGTEHCPKAEYEVHVMLIEPIGTRNTGDVKNDKTIYKPSHI